MKKIILLAAIAFCLTTQAEAQENDFPPVRCGTYVNTVNADAPARKTAKGLIIAGKGAEVRAFSAYSVSTSGCDAYAAAANKYKETFGDKVDVYCMPVPTQSSFYTPDAASAWSRSEADGINRIFSQLRDDVIPVNVFDTLGAHAAEPIYNRTDHHWSPLGAYYAAREFAAVAEVPFRDLSSYEEHVIPGYVGTMYMYTKDMEVKNNPEEFVYYTPKDIEYTTTFIDYKLSKDRKTIIGTSEPFEGPFFKERQNTGAAYLTFVGGDSRIVRVQTPINNGRRVLLLKDSFGNAIAGFLFYSFEEVHIVDCRYFKKNIKKYVEDNGITDIVFGNCIVLAQAPQTPRAYERYLVQ